MATPVRTLQTGSALVPGANLTMTVSAIVEGLYFGLGMLLLPELLVSWFFTGTSSDALIASLRIAGALSLTLGVGAGLTRGGDRSRVLLMSSMLVVAKTLSVLLTAYYLISGMYNAFFWINIGLMAMVAIWNAWQYRVASRV